MGNVRSDCESCQRLVRRYGKKHLEICEFCGHYFYPSDKTNNACTCTSAQHNKERVRICEWKRPTDEEIKQLAQLGKDLEDHGYF
jgi:hypothetical protein